MSQQLVNPKTRIPYSVAHDPITACEAAPAPEIEQVLGDLGNVQDQIEKLVTELRNRLQPVLRSEPAAATMPAPASTGSTPYSAPLAHRIHSVTDNLRANGRLLKEVLRLLEI